MPGYSEAEIDILYKLFRNKKFGRGHMLVDNLVDGFPNHMLGQIKTEIKNLVKKKIIVKIPTKNGDAAYINLNYKNIVYNEIKKSGRYPYLKRR